jgi:hypothetical protein
MVRGSISARIHIHVFDPVGNLRECCSAQLPRWTREHETTVWLCSVHKLYFNHVGYSEMEPELREVSNPRFIATLIRTQNNNTRTEWPPRRQHRRQRSPKREMKISRPGKLYRVAALNTSHDSEPSFLTGKLLMSTSRSWYGCRTRETG